MNKMSDTKAGINSNTLKIIAVTAMLADHIGAVILEPIILTSYRSTGMINASLLEIEEFLRLIIGRTAFPIFCFLLVEGFARTSNRWQYAARLLVFALISEIPFNLAFYQTLFEKNRQNVFLTLFIGLLTMILTDKVWKNIFPKQKIRALSLCAAIVCVGMLLADLLNADYGAYGIMCIVVLYLFRGDKRLQLPAGAVAFIAGDLIMNASTSELLAPLGFLAVACYNGKKGVSMKYLFYCFYPLHLLILSAIRVLFVN